MFSNPAGTQEVLEIANTLLLLYMTLIYQGLMHSDRKNGEYDSIKRLIIHMCRKSVHHQHDDYHVARVS